MKKNCPNWGAGNQTTSNEPRRREAPRAVLQACSTERHSREHSPGSRLRLCLSHCAGGSCCCWLFQDSHWEIPTTSFLPKEQAPILALPDYGGRTEFLLTGY